MSSKSPYILRRAKEQWPPKKLVNLTSYELDPGIIHPNLTYRGSLGSSQDLI